MLLFQAAAAVRALREFSSNSNFILMGDHNSTTDYPPYALITEGCINIDSGLWEKRPDFELYPWDGNADSTPNTELSIDWKKIDTNLVSLGLRCWHFAHVEH